MTRFYAEIEENAKALARLSVAISESFRSAERPD
jgi:hypothetical protein